jgi:hypothetical protein
MDSWLGGGGAVVVAWIWWWHSVGYGEGMVVALVAL